MKHLYRRYTVREWLCVLLLILCIGYIIHNERRASISVRADLALLENARLQSEFIRLNHRGIQALETIMLRAHSIPTLEAAPGLTWERWEAQIATDHVEQNEEEVR